MGQGARAAARDPSPIKSLIGAGSPLGSPGAWFILLQPVAFMTYLTSAIAETNRTPFELPEAE